jgi:SAM-dependent methyltransferase
MAAMSSAKESLNKIPGIGRLARIVKQVYKLPDRLPDHDLRLEQLKQASDEHFEILKRQSDDVTKRINHLVELQDNFHKQLTLLDRQTRESGKPAAPKNVTDSELFADDHLLDVFYANFEDRFRGDEAMIMQRLEEYLPLFTDSSVNFDKYPVLDIGSGRGEFLKLLKDSKIKALGLDINLDMVERANKNGLPTEQGDALAFLEESSAQKYGAITGFHIVEHIPFNMLLRIFNSAHRALVKDGFVIFETPNPENVLVATHSFYLDPSHLHPLPPALLAFALEMSGFTNVEIRRLHADTEKRDEKLPPTLAKHFYGPRDYAVVGYK